MEKYYFNCTRISRSLAKSSQLFESNLPIDLNDAFIIITHTVYAPASPDTCLLPHANQLTFKTRAKRCQLHSSWEHVTMEEEPTTMWLQLPTRLPVHNWPTFPFLSVLRVRVRISINNCRNRIVVITIG